MSERVTKRLRIRLPGAELITAASWVAYQPTDLAETKHKPNHTQCVPYYSTLRKDTRHVVDVAFNASSHSYLPSVFVEIVIATPPLSSVCPHIQLQSASAKPTSRHRVDEPIRCPLLH